MSKDRWKKSVPYQFDLATQTPEIIIDAFKKHIEAGWSNSIFVKKIKGESEAKNYLLKYHTDFAELYASNQRKPKQFKK